MPMAPRGRIFDEITETMGGLSRTAAAAEPGFGARRIIAVLPSLAGRRLSTALFDGL